MIPKHVFRYRCRRILFHLSNERRRYIICFLVLRDAQVLRSSAALGVLEAFSVERFRGFRFAAESRYVRNQYSVEFISADGKVLYIQSNVCCSGNSYTFSLRKLLWSRTFYRSRPTRRRPKTWQSQAPESAPSARVRATALLRNRLFGQLERQQRERLGR